MTPRTSRIVETVLYSADVEKSADWYHYIFGFPIIFRQEDRLRALRVAKDQVLLLFKERGSLNAAVLEGGMIPPHDGSGPVHMAFAMETPEREQWEAHLNARGVAIESRVNWGENDRSLYFRDPDNHLLELISGDHWESSLAEAAYFFEIPD